MSTILPKLGFFVKDRLVQNLRRCRDTKLQIRYLIVLQLDRDRSPEHIAGNLSINRSTVYRVAARFRAQGEFGLFDRRAGNGPNKMKGEFLDVLDRLVRSSPQDHGHHRPSWTRELLVRTLVGQGFPKVHVATLSRALQQIKARRGRPRPIVGCPWEPRRKARRLRKIRQLIENLPANELAFYEDEVDLHLNPKIGYDWMGYGQQKEVLTPGKNQKRYLAGALDVRSGEVIWVEGAKKNSWLFVQLLGKLYLRYPQAKRLHLILDNYCIHDTALVTWALLQAQGRIRLHPLPPYCPNDNKIERIWQDLHAEVTRNHTCPDMDSLMVEVRLYLLRRYFLILDQAEEDFLPDPVS
jgi:transposase